MATLKDENLGQRGRPHRGTGTLRAGTPTTGGGPQNRPLRDPGPAEPAMRGMGGWIGVREPRQE